VNADGKVFYRVGTHNKTGSGTAWQEYELSKYIRRIFIGFFQTFSVHGRYQFISFGLPIFQKKIFEDNTNFKKSIHLIELYYTTIISVR